MTMLPQSYQVHRPSNCCSQPRQHRGTGPRVLPSCALKTRLSRERHANDFSLHDRGQQERVKQQHVHHHHTNSSAVDQQHVVIPPWSTSSTTIYQQQHRHVQQQASALSSALSPQDHQQQHQDCHHEDQDHHLAALQQILQLSPSEFSTMIHQLPDIINYQPHTLRTTLEALCEALHIPHHSLVSILLERPQLLLAPHEAVQVHHQLSSLLGVTPRRLSQLMGSQYCHLMTLTPQDLAGRVTRLCEVMGWRRDDLDTTAAAIGPESFLHLLSSPLGHISQQLTALAAALDCSEAVSAVAAVVQHYPRLLDRRDFLIWPQLKLLADTAGVSARRLLSELDTDQCQGLASILLYEPVWIAAQLRRLKTLVQHQQPTWSDRMIVWLLFRLPTPNALARAKVQMELLQRLVSTHQPWQDGLYKSDDRQLAVLLTADDESLQLIQFLVDTGRESQCGLNLTEVVACSEADFRRRYGQVFEEWLEGRGRAADKSVQVQQP